MQVLRRALLARDFAAYRRFRNRVARAVVSAASASARRAVDAAEDDAVARMEAREVGRLEHADLRKAGPRRAARGRRGARGRRATRDTRRARSSSRRRPRATCAAVRPGCARRARRRPAPRSARARQAARARRLRASARAGGGDATIVVPPVVGLPSVERDRDRRAGDRDERASGSADPDPVARVPAERGAASRRRSAGTVPIDRPAAAGRTRRSSPASGVARRCRSAGTARRSPAGDRCRAGASRSPPRLSPVRAAHDHGVRPRRRRGDAVEHAAAVRAEVRAAQDRRAALQRGACRLAVEQVVDLRQARVDPDELGAALLRAGPRGTRRGGTSRPRARRGRAASPRARAASTGARGGAGPACGAPRARRPSTSTGRRRRVVRRRWNSDMPSESNAGVRRHCDALPAAARRCEVGSTPAHRHAEPSAANGIVVPWTTPTRARRRRRGRRSARASSMPCPSANAASRIGTAPLSPPQATNARSPCRSRRRQQERPDDERAGSRRASTAASSRPSAQRVAAEAEIEIVSPSATKTTISASDESASWKISISALNGARTSPTSRPATKTARKPEPCATAAMP